MKRSQFIKTATLGSAALIASPFTTKPNIMTNKHDYGNAFGLARSLTKEHTYKPTIEGKIPQEIQGTLYRNGPGLFERQDRRKKNILDGDGMIQAFRIADGTVSYRNRFVRTSKWLDEESADRYLYNTWTTLRPGGMIKNAFFQGEFRGQAGVTVRVFNGKLYAFDESSLPYEINPETLETLREVDFDVHFESANTLFAAHNKVDGYNGDWIQFGLENGPKANIQVTIFNSQGKLMRARRYELSMGTYMHDFFVSENYIIFNLQPAVMNPIAFLLGMESYVQSLKWKPKKGSTFMVLHKSLEREPIYLQTEAVWMWHSLNTYEIGEEILCYFCGYDRPDHFLGNHAQTFEIMKPNATPSAATAESQGTLRLIKINPRAKTIERELLYLERDRTFEFPIINDQYSTRRHKYGYLASGKTMGVFHHEINRINMDTGQRDCFDFGTGFYCGEPIFVPKPGFSYSYSSPEPGWLMSLVFDESTEKSFVAILNAEKVTDGPIAKIHLNHHSPLSFHGTWYGT